VEIEVNGSKRQINAGSTVLSLLNELGITPEKVAVEHNMDILARDRFGDTAITDGDKIEIIQFVGGGK